MLTSPHNELLKLARSLHTRKGRHKAGLFLVDSPRAIATMLASGATLAHLLYIPAARPDSSARRVRRVRPWSRSIPIC